MRLRAIKVLACLSILWAAPLLFGGDKAVVPDWVRQAAAEKLPTYPADTDAVILLKDQTYTVIGRNEYIEHLRVAARILRPSGVDIGHFGVRIEKKDKITALHGWALDAAGNEYEVRDKEFTDAAYAGGAYYLYDDDRFRTGKVPSQVGNVVAFECEVHRYPYLDEIEWGVQQDNPVRRAILTIQLPSSFEFKDAWYGLTPVKPTNLGQNRWQWTVTDIPGINQDEEHRPSFAALQSRMKLTVFGTGTEPATESWNSLGRWYNTLTADRRVTTPEITQKARDLTAGKTDFLSKTRAITDFMQAEIRYVSISIGIGGYQPHPAADIFHARYGDCKDKATLLSTMLHEVGIESDYVLIDMRRGAVKKDLPSSSFDHAILAIELPSGQSLDQLHSVISDKTGKKYLLFDPTNEYTPLGDIPYYLQDSYALLITPLGGEIVRTPVLEPDLNRSVRHGEFKLTLEGNLEGNFESKMVGFPADSNRSAFRRASDHDRMLMAERFASRSLHSAALKDLKLEALDKNLNALVLRFDVNSNKYAQVTGQLMLVRPRVLGVYALGLDRKERQYPVVLPATERNDDEYDIEIPAGYVVDDVPESKKVKSPFGSYESEIKVEGSKIHYKRTYISRALEIPTDQIAEFRSFQSQIAEDENAVVVLKKTN